MNDASNIETLNPAPQGAIRSGEPPKVPEMELLERIGSGAYGEVWLARNTATGARRAVKVVYRATFSDERPFNREFEGIKNFESISHSHPSQLALFQVGRNDEGGYFYYVMELADSVVNSASYQSRTLRSALAEGRLLAARALEIALVLTEALAHLHANGLIHRDVKPSNIIFVNGRPKLADIGLVTDASDTRSIVGTEGYLAPEGPGTAAADIYALGKVLYEALTGLDRRQFPELPPEIRSWADHQSLVELNEIVLKACARDTACRYQSADAMLADLKLLEGGKSVQKRRALQRSWSFLWKAAATLAIFSLGMFMLNNERQRRKTLAEQNKPAWEKAGTTNQAAWQALIRARQMGNTYTTVGLSNAIAEWERATELDPNFAAAWSVLSVTIAIAVNEGYIPGTNALPRAKSCAERAIAIDPKYGPAYQSLAQCKIALDCDFKAAEPLFLKSIKLDPSNIISQNNYAWELLHHGEFAKAARIWEGHKSSAPDRPNSYIGLGIIACLSGRQSEGLTLLDEGIRLFPDRPLWWRWRSDILWAMNKRDASASDCLRFIQLAGFHFLDRDADASTLGVVLADRGPEAFVERLLALAEERQRLGQFVSGFELARFHAQLGHTQKALDSLETCFLERRGMLRTIKINPLFHILRDEPRFKALLRQVHLEE